MNEEQTWVIPTGDLQVGTTLSFDLTDGSGQVLHKAGMPINERLKERLKKKNIHSVTIRGAAKFDEGQTESLLLDSFPPQTITAIQAAVESAKTSLRNFVGSLVKDRDANVIELAGNVGQFVEQASQDVASALAVISVAPKRANKEVVGVGGGAIRKAIAAQYRYKRCKLGRAGRILGYRYGCDFA